MNEVALTRKSLDRLFADIKAAGERRQKEVKGRGLCGDNRGGYVCERPAGHEPPHAEIAPEQPKDGPTVMFVWGQEEEP